MLETPPEVKSFPDLDSDHSADVFLRIEHQLSDQRYWELLRWVWIRHRGSISRLKAQEQLLLSPRPMREHPMTPKEREAFAALPEELEAFHGTSLAASEFGWSWALKFHSSYTFARNRFRDGPKVVLGRCLKKDVRAIGVRAEDLMALGYPDSGLKAIYEATAETPYKQQFTGKTETYGVVLRDYHTLAHGRPALYLRSSVLGDLVEILRTRKPKEVYVTNEVDTHPDHKAAFWFVRDAAKIAGYRGNLYTFVVHGKAPPGRAHPVALTKAQQDRKRVVIEQYQTKLSPIHDELAEKFTRAEEVFWLVRIE